MLTGSAANAALEMVSQNNVALNCTALAPLAAPVTVAVRFFEGVPPPSSAYSAANASVNCGADAQAGCAGPLLTVNLPLSALQQFTMEFPSTTSTGAPALVAFPARGTTSDALIKAISPYSVWTSPTTYTAYALTIASAVPHAASVANYPSFIAAMCAACGAAPV